MNLWPLLANVLIFLVFQNLLTAVPPYLRQTIALGMALTISSACVILFSFLAF